MKNRISKLEGQIREKDAVVNFLSNQLAHTNLNGDSSVNKTINDHNDYNKKDKCNVVIIGDSMLNKWTFKVQ